MACGLRGISLRWVRGLAIFGRSRQWAAIDPEDSSGGTESLEGRPMSLFSRKKETSVIAGSALMIGSLGMAPMTHAQGGTGGPRRDSGRGSRQGPDEGRGRCRCSGEGPRPAGVRGRPGHRWSAGHRRRCGRPRRHRRCAPGARCAADRPPRHGQLAARETRERPGLPTKTVGSPGLSRHCVGSTGAPDQPAYRVNRRSAAPAPAWP